MATSSIRAVSALRTVGFGVFLALGLLLALLQGEAPLPLIRWPLTVPGEHVVAAAGGGGNQQVADQATHRIAGIADAWAMGRDIDMCDRAGSCKGMAMTWPVLDLRRVVRRASAPPPYPKSYYLTTGRGAHASSSSVFALAQQDDQVPVSVGASDSADGMDERVEDPLWEGDDQEDEEEGSVDTFFTDRPREEQPQQRGEEGLGGEDGHLPTLPAPSAEDGDDGEGEGEGGPRRRLEVGGAALRLEELGPMVLNADGTVSRITNWAGLTERERQATVRVISKRNAERAARLQEQQQHMQGKEQQHRQQQQEEVEGQQQENLGGKRD